MGNEIYSRPKDSQLPQEFYDLLNRTMVENPDPKDVHELRTWFDRCPDVWRSVFDFAYVVRVNLITRFFHLDGIRMAVEQHVGAIKTSLGYDQTNPLEQLLIENIIITWLRVQAMEFQLTGTIANKSDVSTIEFWERRLTAAQRQYLRATETLARVRKLMINIPLLQLNIIGESGQQLNVAGDLIKR